MPKIDSEADLASVDSYDEIPETAPSAHVETAVEEDAEAKEQLKTGLLDDLGKTSGNKARKQEAARVSPTPSAGDSEPEEEEFEVEAIRDHDFGPENKKAKIRYVRYLVKWKGYPESDNTWEPESNLTDARDLLAAYHHSMGGTPQAKRKFGSDDGASATPPATKRAKKKQNNSATVPEESEEYSDWVPRAESWDDKIKEIVTVERATSGQLHVCVKFTNGKKTKVLRDKAHKAFPMLLLEFYEKHLSV